MRRSTGVSTIAIVALIGSILILGLGVLVAGLALVMPHMPARAGRPTPLPAGFMLAGSLVYILPGVWGVVSGIGLWRLRNWARISTIVFAVVAGLGGAMALVIGLVFFALPPPSSEGLDPETAARAMAIARGVILLMSATLLGVAIWWGVLLTRPTVVQQFTGDGPATTASRRPLSISIVAILMLIGAPFMLFSLLMRAPVPIFTKVLTGRASVIYGLAIAGTLIFCGLGLLRLKNIARLVAIGYFVFGILSSGVFFLAPGRDARITELMARQHELFPSRAASPSPQLPVQLLMVFGLVGGLFGAGVPLYFLVTRGAAFEPTESDPIWPDAPG